MISLCLESSILEEIHCAPFSPTISRTKYFSFFMACMECLCMTQHSRIVLFWNNRSSFNTMLWKKVKFFEQRILCTCWTFWGPSIHPSTILDFWGGECLLKGVFWQRHTNTSHYVQTELATVRFPQVQRALQATTDLFVGSRCQQGRCVTYLLTTSALSFTRLHSSELFFFWSQARPRWNLLLEDLTGKPTKAVLLHV